MELLQLKYFKAVADRGKISDTAAELFISPPALSASISRLEKELGGKLFDRSNNKITLNEQGRIFLRYVNQVFTSLESAKIDIQHSLQTKSETISIAVTTSGLWLDLFAACTEQFPDIKLSSTTLKLPQLATLDLTQQFTFLLADKMDMEFCGTQTSEQNLNSSLLFQDQPYVMVPQNHRLAKRKRVYLNEIENENMYLPMPEQSMNMRIRELFRDTPAALKNVNEYSANICQYMVEKGAGISFSSRYTFRRAGDAPHIPIAGLNCQWEQNIYWHKNRTLTNQEEMLKAFIIDFFNKY